MHDSHAHLPRVTYTNYKVDFSPVHDFFDRQIPRFCERHIGGRYPNLIGGGTHDGGTPYAVASPIDSGLTLGEFIAASPDAVHAAVSAARAAYPKWSRLHWQERVFLLRRVADELDRDKYHLAMAALLEVGKSRLEAIGETEEVVDFVRYYCDEMERHHGFTGDTARAYPNEHARYVLKPYGVFAVIAPFNFPVAMAINMLTGAVLTGNTAVFKPSPQSGLTAYYLVQSMQRAGLPAGVVNLVCGGDETGRALTGDDRIDGVVFTGSYKVGMALHRQMTSGPYVRPCIVEMGGKNPSYVSRHADLDAAAGGVMRSAFGMSGQKCSANSKVYVHREVADDFLGRLTALTAKLALGDPRERDTYLGPVVSAESGERFEQASALARQDGAILTGGNRRRGGLYDKGAYVEPTIVTGLTPGHRLNKDELFCPFLSVQTFTDLEAAVRDGNDVLYGLTAGCYSQDPDEVDLFFRTAEAGVLYVNRMSGATTGTWPGIQTFTGWKGSGITGKGGMGPFYLPQFMREQSQTRWFGAI